MGLIRTKDDIYLEIPDGMAPDAPEVREAVQAERAGRYQRKFQDRMETPEFKSKIAKDVAQADEMSDPLKDMGVVGKTMANLGAGFNAAKTGVQQLLGRGPSDEQLRDTREMDDRLAKSTDMGILPDWMPTAGSALQVAGEAAPAMIIPGGPATSAGAKALMRTPMLGRALAAATKTPLRAGMTGGAVAGAMTPTTSDESRLMNIGIGGAAGSALPLAMKAYQFGRGFTEKGAQEAAGKIMGVTADTPLPAHPAALSISGAENVPLSTAATYADPASRLARAPTAAMPDPESLALPSLELASRARPGPRPAWDALDRGTRQAVWENVEGATQRAGTEGPLREARSAGWRQEAAKAFQAVRPRVWEKERQQFYDAIQRMHRTPKGQGEMRGVIYEISRQMDEMGDKFTPDFLAEIRARMAGSIKGSPNDPFVSAPRSDPAFRALRDQIDDVLNSATKNKWERVKTRYATESIPVAQAKAETAVRGSFVSPEDTFKVSVKDGVPDVTEAQLRRSITGVETKNKFGNAPSFAKDSGRVLKGTLQALEQKNVTNAAKSTATGGGGSMTNPLALAGKAIDQTQAGGWIGRAIDLARNVGDSRALKELDQALIDPQHYYEVVRRTIAAGKPITPAMEIAIQAANVGAGTALPNMMQEQQEQ